jgi:hypothetical protein
MTNWEYYELKNATIEEMNKLGNEGWELVLTVFSNVRIVPGFGGEKVEGVLSYTFKRPKL